MGSIRKFGKMLPGQKEQACKLGNGVQLKKSGKFLAIQNSRSVETCSDSEMCLGGV